MRQASHCRRVSIGASAPAPPPAPATAHQAGAAAGDDLKVRELDLKRDSAAANTGALAVAPHLVDDLLKRVPRRFVGEEIDGKRVLGPNGFAYPVGADGPLMRLIG
jgi:hypothetical protein